MDQQTLLQNAELFVRHLFAGMVSETFTYHNIAHTERVAEVSRLMSEYYHLDEEDRTSLLIAAWFHDTGYVKGTPDGHEAEGQRIVAEFLREQVVSESVLRKVMGCIGATKMPQSPESLIEQIICDADLHHLGTEAFREESKLLRKELRELKDEEIGKKDWRRKNIEFLEGHRYFTDYAITHYEPIKQQNLQALLEKVEGKKNGKEKEAVQVKMEHTVSTPQNTPSLVRETVEVQSEKIDKIRKEKDKGTDTRTDRSIATMFRIMSDNHVSLSQMADSKANIMISVNTIVLSIMVSVLFSKLQYYPQFIIPTILLCAVSMTAIIFAILATRPNVNKGTFNPDDIKNKKVNLLFFGNFFKMQLPDYEWAMKEMMNDKEYLNGSMIKDIYYLGKVLAKKYKFLRLSYNIFMFGLIVSMLAFVIAFWV